MGLTTYFSLLFLVLNLYPSDKIALLLGEREVALLIVASFV